MVKSGEKQYFKKIGKEGVELSVKKPFSDRANTGSLLHDIAAVFSLLPDEPERLKIIDLGCGTGWTSSFYAQAGHDVVGVDIAPEAIETAKKAFAQYKNLSFVCRDYDKLIYRDEFDVAIFFDSLHHSEDERDGLIAAYRALKPGGTIIICEPGFGHSNTESSRMAVELYNVNERDMPPKLSTKQLKACGFTNLKTFGYPAMIHRALYGRAVGKAKLFRLNHLMRGVTTGALATVARPWHGIVTGKK